MQDADGMPTYHSERMDSMQADQNTCTCYELWEGNTAACRLSPLELTFVSLEKDTQQCQVLLDQTLVACIMVF